jgi:hypothetical protein
MYIKGVRENSGHLTIVFERFHIVSQVVVMAFWMTDYGK